MADMDTILKAIEEDIIKLIYQITPNEYASEQFSSPSTLKEHSLRETTGKPRLFQVAWPELQPKTVGTSAMVWGVKGTITIGYPLHDWDIARASDYQQIFETIRTNPSPSITGCSFRVIDAFEQPERDDDEENNWSWTVIPIRAVIETS